MPELADYTCQQCRGVFCDEPGIVHTLPYCEGCMVAYYCRQCDRIDDCEHRALLLIVDQDRARSLNRAAAASLLGIARMLVWNNAGDLDPDMVAMLWERLSDEAKAVLDEVDAA